MAALEVMVFVVIPLGLVGCMLLTLWLVGSATHGFMGHVHDLRQYLRWTHGGLTRLERRLAELERQGPAAAPPALPAPPPAGAVTTTPLAEALPVLHLEED